MAHPVNVPARRFDDPANDISVAIDSRTDAVALARQPLSTFSLGQSFLRWNELAKILIANFQNAILDFAV